MTLQRFRTHFQGRISVKIYFFLNFLLDFFILKVYNGFTWSSVKEEKYQKRMAVLPETLSPEEISISALGPGQGMSAEAVCQCVRIGKQVTITGLVYTLQDDSEGVKKL